MDAVFVSDVHCDGPDSAPQRAFLQFLGGLRTTRLCLVGDIFHAFWAPSGAAFEPYQPVLDALADFELVVLPGNHDFHLPAFLAGNHPRCVAAGARVGSRLALPLSEVRVVLTHGDEADTSARYRALHAVLRGSAFAALIDAAGPTRAWTLLHRLAGRLGGEPNPVLVAAQRSAAQRELDGGAQLVVTGHTHAPGLEALAGGQWLNCGDWVRHRTYGVLQSGRVELRRFEAPG